MAEVVKNIIIYGAERDIKLDDLKKYFLDKNIKSFTDLPDFSSIITTNDKIKMSVEEYALTHTEGIA